MMFTFSDSEFILNLLLWNCLSHHHYRILTIVIFW